MTPKTIKIIGKRYKIIKRKDFENYGESDEQKQTIKLREDMLPDLELDTFIHEVTHAIDHQMSLKMSERQVHGVGAGLAAVLIDNPKLLNYLQELISGE
ncbi:hypothetical protein UFOVP146_15 [uncultured Caudovirales phage]|jgi:hypothetical protein|uniref:Uncharacterized protein n=1 Tax=uncultured Caudovirales phage TaxID=2100421 RepID=A0A6J7VKA0_9CAUD|nr:hypothetical protein UFOVP146_15 [uncultured Caudovirales phage]